MSDVFSKAWDITKNENPRRFEPIDHFGNMLKYLSMAISSAMELDNRDMADYFEAQISDLHTKAEEARERMDDDDSLDYYDDLGGYY
tara:strand:- start:157 stop:417 length:261 start_codon:yes stop_codon:yes gene_type:complete